MVLKLLGSRLRQERKHRHGLAKHLEGLLYKQCWAYACKILVTRAMSMLWCTFLLGCQLAVVFR